MSSVLPKVSSCYKGVFVPSTVWSQALGFSMLLLALTCLTMCCFNPQFVKLSLDRHSFEASEIVIIAHLYCHYTETSNQKLLLPCAHFYIELGKLCHEDMLR